MITHNSFLQPLTIERSSIHFSRDNKYHPATNLILEVKLHNADGDKMNVGNIIQLLASTRADPLHAGLFMLHDKSTLVQIPLIFEESTPAAA